MYFSALAGLIAGLAHQRKSYPSPLFRPAPARELTELSDHHLRDIGYVRERVRHPRSPLMWM
ncbi:MAG: hypothetical protein KF694_03690 [Mesorhizobium sp.]|nr:hypothetical protein [Mesorhizobium sp.]